METEVIMRRTLGHCEVRQKSKSSYLCAIDIVTAGNKYRLLNDLPVFNFSVWLNSKSTQEFIKTLEAEIGQKAVIKGKGKNNPTWVHPYIFIDLALALNPKFKVEVYGWLYDYLLKYRNDSGDSYKKMCGALYVTQSNKFLFPQEIKMLAERIKVECNVTDWEHATEEQLTLRNKIYDNIALLSDIIKDRETLYNVAIKKAKENK